MTADDLPVDTTVVVPTVGAPVVVISHWNGEIDLTPAQARMLAARLLTSAERAEHTP